MEHPYQFAEHAFPGDPPAKAQWCGLQRELLLSSQVEAVIDHIASIQAGEKDKKQLTVY